MAEEIEYKGYRLQARSYRDQESQKWVPYIVLTPIDEAQTSEMPMSWECEFDSQLEADDYALDGAQFYIDNQYNV